MPWFWVAAGLILWGAAAFAVMALCMCVRRIDSRLGRDRGGVLSLKKREPRRGTQAKVD